MDISKIKLENEILNIKDEIAREKINNITKNVKDFGAKGDGNTDDTLAIIEALNSLENGESLFFPSGDYIVYSDYVDNNNNPSYPLDKILKLVNKKNITIYGNGKNSIIRPPLQHVSPSKLNFPCTLTIDKCNNIEIYNLTIESKGENYGDADAGVSVSQELRQQFVMSNGGSAILISGSENVYLHDCDFRLAGSCGVVYHSDISNAIVENCFANACSLGYAGFAIDDFCYNDNTKNHKIYYKNVKVNAETFYQRENGYVQIGSNMYAGKGGIVTEGSTINQINAIILNSEFKDCFGNPSNNYIEGAGIILQLTNAIIKNCVLDNNYIGVRISNTEHYGNNIQILNNDINSKYAGIYIINSGSNLPESNIDISYNKIYVNKNSTIPSDMDEILSKMGAIVSNKAYSNVVLNALYNDIIAKYTCYIPRHISIVNFKYNVSDSVYGIFAEGGGTFELENNNITFDNSYMCHLIPYGEDLIVANLNVSILNNIIKSKTSMYNAIDITGGTRPDLVTITEFDLNKFVNCSCMNNLIDKNSSLAIYGVCTEHSEIAGGNTIVGFKFDNQYIPFKQIQFIDDDLDLHETLNFVEFNSATNIAKYYVEGNLQNNMTNDKVYKIF